MNRKTNAVLAGVLALTLAGCAGNSTSSAASAGSADHLARIQETGKITVGLEGDWQPFGYHDDSDALVGFDVEVAAEIAKRLGVEVEYIEGSWDGLLTGLDTGTWDLVVNGVTVTEDRQAGFDFTDAYAYDHAVLVVAAGNTEITSFEDLSGKKIANSSGSSYEALGLEYGAVNTPTDDLAWCMNEVKNGGVDATINAATSIADYLSTTGETALFKIVAEAADPDVYAIPLKKGTDNDTLREAINQALADMKADGTLAALSEKYFGMDLTK